MRARWPLFATILVLGAGYIGYPYATLYRLDVAMRHSDAATLRAMVDWYSVREGLKEDICDMVMEGPSERPSTPQVAASQAATALTPQVATSQAATALAPQTAMARTATPRPAATRADNELPPFGSSFVRGMTGNALDHAVTPETLVSMGSGGTVVRHADAHVVWAFFDTPTQFSVYLSTFGAAEPIHVILELRGLQWQVRRVSLPSALLQMAGAGT